MAGFAFALVYLSITGDGTVGWSFGPVGLISGGLLVLAAYDCSSSKRSCRAAQAGWHNIRDLSTTGQPCSHGRCVALRLRRRALSQVDSLLVMWDKGRTPGAAWAWAGASKHAWGGCTPVDWSVLPEGGHNHAEAPFDPAGCGDGHLPGVGVS